MRFNKAEDIVLLLMVGCAILILAAITRYFCLLSNIDTFTANVIFFIVIGFSISVYISLNRLIDNFLLPKIISSKLFVRQRTALNKDQEGVEEGLKVLSNEEIRKTFQQTSKQNSQEQLNKAINYTRTIFAPYTSDSELERLCDYIEMYSKGLELKNIHPIKINKQIKSNDIYHYGWNIWNHFRTTNQTTISNFLKSVFSPTLREVSDVITIKKKLRISDNNCIIPLAYKLKN